MMSSKFLDLEATVDREEEEDREYNSDEFGESSLLDVMGD